MKVGIIGGGPSGMMAAIMASQGGHDVTLLEKNEKLGKKLFITGKGRCNICNDCEDHEFFEQVMRNPSFLYSSFYTFPPFSLMTFFEERNLKLKVERGRRVFPDSDKSSDVIQVLRRELDRQGVEVKLKTEILSIEKKDGFILTSQKESLCFDKILIATGGFTYPACGSTGQGYSFAQSMGHSIIEPRAGLVGLRTNHFGKKDLIGLSLKNIELLAEGKEKSAKEFGDLLFTHYGVSGPTVLSISSRINRWDKVNLYIDFKPGLDREKLDQRLLRELENAPNKGIDKILETLSPKSLVPILLGQLGLDEKTKANQLKRESRAKIVDIYKKFPINYQGLFEESTGIVTSGGVKVDEINPSTMESKICPGLYFAGEVVDVDALTGGYNLQIAFSTGYLAGMHIGEEKEYDK